MADTAFQTRYRQEFVQGFEQRQSLLRGTTTTEADVRGNTAVFLVADTNGATAVTRGTNGMIPARADNLTQYSCVLTEQHDLVRRNGFNLFASQGDGRRIMQDGNIGVLNRKIDSQILTELETGTQDTGSAQTMTFQLAVRAGVILGNNDVPMDGNIFGLITPAAHAYMMQLKEFSSADYTKNSPMDSMLTRFRWAGVNWIVHPNLTGAGSSVEKCIVYHKSAIGSAYDKDNVQVEVGYDQEQDYSFSRATIYHGAKLLQNSGVIIVNHDGSAFAAQ